LLLLNDREVGRTPISVPIEWDGDYDVRLRYDKDVGTPDKPKIVRYYLHTHRQTVTPWFDIIPLDLAAELLPVEFKDEQVWAFLIPEVQEPTDKELIERARALKAQLDALLRSSRSPLGQRATPAIRTLKDANRVWWALKRMADARKRDRG